MLVREKLKKLPLQSKICSKLFSYLLFFLQHTRHALPDSDATRMDQKLRRRRVCEKLALVPGKLDHATVTAYSVADRKKSLQAYSGTPINTFIHSSSTELLTWNCNLSSTSCKSRILKGSKVGLWNVLHYQNVDISGFLCHSDCMWNQFWRI